MNEIDPVDRLARLARGARAPSVDVADAVMRRIAARPAARPAWALWPLVVGVSFAAAATLVLAAWSYMALEEPAVELLGAVREALL